MLFIKQQSRNTSHRISIRNDGLEDAWKFPAEFQPTFDWKLLTKSPFVFRVENTNRFCDWQYRPEIPRCVAVEDQLISTEYRSKLFNKKYIWVKIWSEMASDFRWIYNRIYSWSLFFHDGLSSQKSANFNRFTSDPWALYPHRNEICYSLVGTIWKKVHLRTVYGIFIVIF